MIKNKFNNFIASILGLIAATFVALILFPVVYIVFNTFFELYFFTEAPKNAWINDAIIIITVLLWILAFSGAGGYVASKYSERKEDFSILLFIVFSFIIMLFLYGPKFFDSSLAAIPIVTFASGACLGNLLWLRKKKSIGKTKSVTEIE